MNLIIYTVLDYEHVALPPILYWSRFEDLRPSLDFISKRSHLLEPYVNFGDTNGTFDEDLLYLLKLLSTFWQRGIVFGLHSSRFQDALSHFRFYFNCMD